jgi:hypothetical protein
MPRCHLNASTVDAGFSINKRGGAQTVRCSLHVISRRDINFCMEAMTKIGKEFWFVNKTSFWPRVPKISCPALFWTCAGRTEKAANFVSD